MAASEELDWKMDFSAILAVFGHRNWIVVADAAYPEQSNPGIETMVAEDAQADVVRYVYESIISSGHLRASVHVDSELAFVSEEDAPGVEEYRRQLQGVLAGARVRFVLHERLIAKLDRSRTVVSHSHHQDVDDHSIYFGLLRTRLWLLERRSGAAAPRVDGCCGNEGTQLTELKAAECAKRSCAADPMMKGKSRQ